MPDDLNEDPTALLAELRARVEAATTDISQLTTELAERDRTVEELESALDTILGLVEAPILLVGDDRRIRGLSRGAAEHLGRDAAVGRPLSSVVAEDVLARIDAHHDDPPPEGRVPRRGNGRPAAPRDDPADAVAHVEPLAGDGVIVVLRDGDRGHSPVDAPRAQARRLDAGAPDRRREHGRRPRGSQ